eukprot:TRINITY_DN3305_c0_g1_i17.p1 TRINITY_DN3305_c0_g1~~TRINITY_DN3305_c0_g1_i17.p1  ORF type:complete len:1772 (-),score=339.58 TRINITY_DN3305_c0_g1_i17:1837-7152(-)
MLRNLVKLSSEESAIVEDTSLWNMISLGQLNEQTMLQTIRERFERNLIYTYSGSVLVSVNPYQLLPYYSADMMRMYRKQRPEELPPHLFAIAESAYRSMRAESKNQSIIISGESGSGKTEAAKVIIQYLAFINSQHTWVEQQILEANPLLEAFGNAKTVSNDNSSRFGKMVQIYFNQDGQISGAKIERYLLEKSRIVYQNPGERNYHIFYQLLAGSTLDERASLHLGSAEEYRYLNKNGCFLVDEMNDEEEFEAVKRALTILGIGDRSSDIFRVISAILHLGNIEFGSPGAQAKIENESSSQSVKYVSELLQLPEEVIRSTLLERKVTAGNDCVTIPLSVDEAGENRDALAKSLYDRLFRWLVEVINKSILPSADQMRTYISILDIFGFESVENNSYEQFCINYANERLQQEFVNYVFKLEQEEYRRDELKWTYIDFKDNKECLDLIEKKPLGMLFLLDDECRLPDGTDQSWLEKVAKNHQKNPNFSLVKTDSTGFVLHHYVGKVQYNASRFMEKSRDMFFFQFKDIESHSKDPFISEILATSSRLRAGSILTKRQIHTTLGIKFKEQVDNLMSMVHESTCHYLRCIRPNTSKKPSTFENGLVIRQLQYSGMLSTVELRKAGYPVRLTFDAFIKRYRVILPKSVKLNRLNEKENCRVLLAFLDNREGVYQLGKSMIFLRYQMHADLERLLHQLRNSASRTIGKAYRTYRFLKMCKTNAAASKIQAAYRRHSLRQSKTLEPVKDMEVESPPANKHAEEKPTQAETNRSEKPEETSANSGSANAVTAEVEPITKKEILPPENVKADIAESIGGLSLSPSRPASKSLVAEKTHRVDTEDTVPRPLKHGATDPSIRITDGHMTLGRRSVLPNALPKVVTRMFEYLRIRGIDQVGIFRVAGAAAEVQPIMKSIEEGKDVVFHSVADCNVVATVLKHYIRNMKEPLATFQLYDEFIKAADVRDREEMVQAIKKLVNKLPSYNRVFLQELCLFLSQVAEHSSVNKMNSSNLAIVFAPNIFRTQAELSGLELMKSQQSNIVMAVMIESCAQIFEDVGPSSPRPVKTQEVDISAYHLPEYASLHFSVPSSSGMFRNRSNSVMNLLIHTKSQITQPLHKNLPLELRRDALELFRNVLKFMGDLNSQIPPIQICQSIVEKGLKFFDLRDEILAQICRQISNNKDNKSRALGWQLMVHCLSCFNPSQTFFAYLKNFLVGNVQQPKAQSDKRRAQLCIEFMDKLAKAGPRTSNISQMEFDAISRDLDLTLGIRISNNRTIQLDVTPVSQVQDICYMMAKNHPNPFSKFYGLYAVISKTAVEEPDHVDLHPSVFLMDFVVEFETKKKEVNAKKAATFYFLYKQRIFTGEEITNHDYVPLLYVQLSQAFLEGQILLPANDIAFLSACEIQRHHGDLDQKALLRLEFASFLPRYALQGTQGGSWKQLILQELQAFSGMNPQSCIHTFLNRIVASGFYGSATFPIKMTVFGSKVVEYDVSVSVAGLFILNKHSQGINARFPMSALIEGVMQDETHAEIFFEHENDIRTMTFYCGQTKDMVRLLNDYLEHLKLKSNKAVALFDYHVDDPTLLSFSKGDLIVILEKNPLSGWYNGSAGGKQGWFPSDYVRIVISDDLSQVAKIEKTVTRVDSEVLQASEPVGLKRADSKPQLLSKQSRGLSDVLPAFDECVKVFAEVQGKYFMDKTSPVADVLLFSNSPIHEPLTALDQKDRDNALQSFIAIMKFMGDYVYGDDHYFLVDSLCACALSSPVMREEIYLQLIKQLTGNPRG